MIARAVFPLFASFTLLCLTSRAADEQAPRDQRLRDLRGVADAHFSRDGSRIFVQMRNGEAALWSVEDGTRVGETIDTKTASAVSLIWTCRFLRM
jgi:hypothetical protein